MATPVSNRDAEHVLRCFLPDFRCQLVSLGNRGGFSGASIWRAEGELASFCLKAWPEPGIDAAGLERVHTAMMRARHAGLPFVPAMQSRIDRSTWIHSNGRFWDLATWMPGRADFHEQPS